MRIHRISSGIAVILVIAALAGGSLASAIAIPHQPTNPGAIGNSDTLKPPISPREVAVTLGDDGSAVPRTIPEGSPGPDVVSVKGGWDGLDYSSSCNADCLPADPSVATGNGYVFEVANSVERIWITNGTLVHNASLDSLFGTSGDALAAPQVVYDPSTLRWFISVEDVTRSQIFFAGSLTSDPTATYDVQHVNPPGGDIPTQPVLAIDAVDLVLTTNLYHNGVFEGAQIWAANKSQILADAGVATWSDTPNLSNQSVVPADPMGLSRTMYLVTDGTQGGDLNLFNLSGAPPGAVTLSPDVVFQSVTNSPPPANQSGTLNRIDVGPDQLQSAGWSSGTLWAASTVACTPMGDTGPRACLHLWKITTATNTLVQSFNWSSGPGTYDFYPAVAVDALGNLAIVFEESSTTMYPSVEATGQSVADQPDSLEPSHTIRSGSGPDNVTGQCPDEVCPFGNYSDIAAAPQSTGTYWLVGEYSGSNYLTDFWHTWVNEVSVSETYRVNISEVNLAHGTSWSITLDGSTITTTSPTIFLNESNGEYTFTVRTPIAGSTGVQFAASPSAGSYSVASAPRNVTINFTEQYSLTTSVSPSNAGTISPTSGWYNASGSLSLNALASPDHEFAEWNGSGSGAYNGTANPAPVVMNGPLFEQANFSTVETYPVVFSESGLPVTTYWSVLLNGVANGSTGNSITFNEPNGSYSFSVTSPVDSSPGTRSVANLTNVSLAISGSGYGQSVPFLTQFELTTSASPSDEGTANPASGWFAAGSNVELSATADSGFQFVSWQGEGQGNYTGAENPADLTLRGPANERANFTATPGTASTPTSSAVPWWVYLVALLAIAAVVALAIIAFRRREPPPLVAAPVIPWQEDESTHEHR